MKTSGGLVAFFLLGVLIDPAPAYNIDTCGVRIPDKEVAVLTTDLVCDPATRGVTVGSGATLSLNGHTIEVPGGWGVWCEAGTRCTVTGGGSGGAFGEIRGGDTGIYLANKSRARIDGVVIRDCATGVKAEDWHNGRSGASAMLFNVEISGSDATGIRVGKLKAANVIVADNPGSGIAAGQTGIVKAKALTVVRNATSAVCASVGCSGIDVGNVKGSGMQVIDNAGYGVHARIAKIRESTIVENRRLGALRSLSVGELLRVNKVTCDASFGWGSQSSVPWGVCSLDGN